MVARHRFRALTGHRTLSSRPGCLGGQGCGSQTALRDAGLIALGDKGYHGYGRTGDHVLSPYTGKNKPQSQKDANRAHARLRGPGERANVQLKTWHVLRRLLCCPYRAGRLAKAIHVLQNHKVAAG